MPIPWDRDDAIAATVRPMTERPVNLTVDGPADTILDPESDEALQALAAALGRSPEERRDAVSAVLVDHPRFLDAWAQLGRLGRDEIESYAAFRVGYHRGLDRLRANGWRGTGSVRWAHVNNRGFLRALSGLAAAAARIGEEDEARRCEQFLRQLDPAWPPADLD